MLDNICDLSVIYCHVGYILHVYYYAVKNTVSKILYYKHVSVKYYCI